MQQNVLLQMFVEAFIHAISRIANMNAKNKKKQMEKKRMTKPHIVKIYFDVHI